MSDGGTSSACFRSKYSCMTSTSSLNWPFVVREASSTRNLLTACDLDSPIDFAEGSQGSGTINLPSGDRECSESRLIKGGVSSISQKRRE